MYRTLGKPVGAEASGTRDRAAQARKIALDLMKQQAEFPLMPAQRAVKAQGLLVARLAPGLAPTMMRPKPMLVQSRKPKASQTAKEQKRA